MRRNLISQVRESHHDCFSCRWFKYSLDNLLETDQKNIKRPLYHGWAKVLQTTRSWNALKLSGIEITTHPPPKALEQCEVIPRCC